MMQTQSFRHLLTGFVVEAVQVTEENIDAVAGWVPAGMVYSNGLGPWVSFTSAYHRRSARVGEWVWRDPATLSFYPAGDGFEEIHQAVEVEA